jgi:hypothetical protein
MLVIGTPKLMGTNYLPWAYFECTPRCGLGQRDYYQQGFMGEETWIEEFFSV